jgi:hypothetical protein
MKLRVANLGRIAEAELDIRPLTVFIGTTGTNKTWTAYALYAALRLLAWNTANKRAGGLVLPLPITNAVSLRAKALLEQIQTVSAGQVEIEIQRSEVFGATGSSLTIAAASSELERAIGVAMGPSTEVAITLEPDEIAHSVPDVLRMSIAAGRRTLESSTFLRGRHQVRANVYFQTGAPFEWALSERLASLLEDLALPHPVNALAMPAERAMLAQSYGSGRTQTTPIQDFSNFIHDAATAAEVRIGVDFANARDLSLLLESAVLKGTPQCLPESERQLEFVPLGSNAPVLPIRAAASLAKSMTPLAFYLAHYATPGDALVIDEPEMNAHPEAVVALTELLAALANRGVNVVITTQSPYVVDHLTNLMEAFHLPQEQKDQLAKRLKLGTLSALIDPEKVSVYEFTDDGDHVTVQDRVMREDRTIDWSTFARVSDETTNLYSEILERGNPGGKL